MFPSRTSIGFLVTIFASSLAAGDPPSPAADLLTGVPGWPTEGDKTGARFGYAVAPAGDVNGDGLADVIVSAPGFPTASGGGGNEDFDDHDDEHDDDDALTPVGAVFVHLGTPSGPATAPAWTARGERRHAGFGWSVGGAGDLNGDGFDDVIVGAPLGGEWHRREGTVFVYLGSPSGLGSTAAWTARANQDHAWLGVSVAIAGDVNGDGFDDVIAGAPGFAANGMQAGAAFVWLGSASGPGESGTPENADWCVKGTAPAGGLGSLVARAGDVNGDGFDDVAVSASRFWGNTCTVLVYAGSSSGLSREPIWTRTVPCVHGGAPVVAASAGDVNGDSYGDLLVGASGFQDGEAKEGAAFLHLGSAAGLSMDPAWSVETNQTAARGYAVATAGDVNSDGFADVVLGAFKFDDEARDEGRVFVYLGSSSGLAAMPAWTATGRQRHGSLGFSVASAGDVNGDGASDIIAGAPGYSDPTCFEGAAFVWLGSPPPAVPVLPDPISGLVCDSVAADVDLSWLRGVEYDSIEVRRDGVLVATLDGDELGTHDANPGPGAHDYSVSGIQDGVASAPQVCSITVEPVKALDLDTVEEISLQPSRPRAWYNLSVPVGSPVTLTATDADPSHANAIYIRWGEPARPYFFDQAARNGNQSNQKLVIQAAREATCSVLIEAIGVGESSNQIRLLAESRPLDLERTSIRYAGTGKTKRVDGAVWGVGFGPQTTFSLEPLNGGAGVPSIDRLIVSSSRAEVAFDLSQAAEGFYDLTAEDGALVARLPRAFELRSTAIGSVLEVQLSGPQKCRYDHERRLSLRYKNAGDEEQSAPILRVTTPGDARTKMRLAEDSELEADELQLLGAHPGGVAGTLPAGGEGEVPVLFRSQADPGSSFAFEVQVFKPLPGAPVDWKAFEPAPGGMTAEQWASVRVSLPGILGKTWNQYQDALAAIATRLARRSGHASSVKQAFRFAVREAYGRPSSAVIGILKDRDTGSPLAGVTVLALDGGAVASSASSEPDGRFVLDWLQGGKTYRIASPDHDTGDPDVTVPEGGDFLGLEISAAPQPANGLEPACPGCNEEGLPEAPPLVPRELFSAATSFEILVIGSWDPNEKDGPIGQGAIGPLPEDPAVTDGGTIAAGAPLVYTVLFENVAQATADAQWVQITDTLPPELNPESFRFLDIQIGRSPLQRVSPGAVRVGSDVSGLGTDRCAGFDAPCEPKTFSTRLAVTQVDETDGTELPGLVVEISGKRDGASIVWTFNTVTDGLSDPERGFLRPNLSLSPEELAQDPALAFDPRYGQGEAFVSYGATTQEQVMSGSEIKNEATVRFDNLPPLTTNQWTNTVSLDPEVPHFPRPVNGLAPAVPADVLLQWSSQLSTSFGLYIWRDGEARPSTPITVSTDFYRVPVRLAASTTYHWQVTAFRETRSVEGPVWSFRTVGARFQRGDIDANGKWDLSDAVFTLSYLYTGGQAPPCEKSADVNDSGVVNLSDPVYILRYLFSGLSAPPPPFESCGEDPTEDDLTCDSFGACE